MIVYTDSDAARLVIVNPGTTARTKHYESWMQYCRELYLKPVSYTHLTLPTKA